MWRNIWDRIDEWGGANHFSGVRGEIVESSTIHNDVNDITKALEHHSRISLELRFYTTVSSRSTPSCSSLKTCAATGCLIFGILRFTYPCDSCARVELGDQNEGSPELIESAGEST